MRSSVGLNCSPRFRFLPERGNERGDIQCSEQGHDDEADGSEANRGPHASAVALHVVDDLRTARGP